MKLNTIIIGAGPIGLTCGIEATKRNLSYLIIEKGCIVNSVFNYPVNMTFFSTSDRLEIGNVPFVSRGDKPTRREALEYYRRVVDAWKLKINTYEKVISIEKGVNHFNILTNKAKYVSGNVIISTGFFDYPNLLNVPGENLPKVFHYFKEAHPYAYKKVAVIGAGNSAVDVALETFRRGAEVTMIIREDKLKDSVKYWVKPDIENRIKEGSIKAFFNSTVKEIKEDEIIFNSPEGLKSIPNDFVFAMTGYHPDYEFLSKAGIKFTSDENKIPVFNPETFETNIKGLYLAGVVCGGMETNKWFIENSRDHAEKIFNHITGKNS
ncbi:MAG: YpdA family putative bacillithiol disulfide reductase [Ignavibacterium album]|jgi:thioredoxin reductase (NADPH)|uniref:YpdA family putative bacillithiol disulfide reductase n=1 Tax=Ignavibacterium album TaxID=591197 RepID=UPI0026EEFD93|nr:YpdA family putative bacillithiol disulfide reductase [Ignavibacterium album]MCX8106376.1 YpdA family putative bacillithiol disulfide reductase [Ignavibacterium album]